MGFEVHAGRPVRPPEWRVALAGVLIVGVSYGLARYGYGLFLPQLRETYDLSVSTVGFIGSATYVGYLVSLTLVGLLARRVGPRPLVVCAGLSAAAGMATVAISSTVSGLVIGLVLAGTSSGWAWAPYSDAVDRLVAPGRRHRVMAVVPAGTAFGVLVAGPLAYLMSGSVWRLAWALFAALAVVATVENARLLPRGPQPVATVPNGRGSEPGGRRWFARAGSGLLFASALSYGVVGAVYWTFAVDAIAQSRAGASAAPLFWTLIGLAGTAGVLTGAVLSRLGLRLSHVVLFAANGVAVALIGIAPGAPALVVLSAVVYGPTFMAISGLLAVASYELFRDRPTTGFSATVFFLGVGTIVGPAAGGLVADHHGLRVVFVLAGGVAVLTALAGLRRAAGRGTAPSAASTAPSRRRRCGPRPRRDAAGHPCRAAPARRRSGGSTAVGTCRRSFRGARGSAR